MATRGLRIGIAGATGALGTEVLSVLDASRVPIAQLVAVAGESSLGCDIEFQGEVVAVATELPALHGLDLFLNCAPAAAAADIVRAALRAEVPCIDASGAFAARAEVPLVLVAGGFPAGVPEAGGFPAGVLEAGGAPVGAEPLLAAPADAALVWTPLLRALGADAAPRAVQATVLEAASAAGRAGIDALTAESLALFNQQELPEPVAGRAPLAFDLHPLGAADGEGGARERALQSALARLLPEAPAVSARWVQVPVFVGQASSLRIVWERPVDAVRAAELLAKAPGVELWSGAAGGPNLRAASGRDVVIVGSPEPDPADPTALRVWAVADILQLAARNAVALAIGALEARGALDGRGLH